VHFVTSCQPSVEKTFDRGVALLHSFWFSAAIEAFNKVLADDPQCAMANWGIAMSWWSNPFGGFRSTQALAAGSAAIEKGKSIGAKTERERAYILAAGTLFQDAAKVPQRTRTLAYEKAMEALAGAHPDDPEARIFYALALDQTALPTDKTYANQLKAAAILEEEFRRQPDHPGLAHYIIHSFDSPSLAPRALNAANRYSKIAPAAPHALHMPSHTFTRVGLWAESIEANRASAMAARKEKASVEELHALDYQAYAYLQTAQDDAARAILKELKPLGARIETASAGNAAPPPAGYYALAAIPARLALERAAWNDAAALVPQTAPFPWVEAVTYFARALGAARSGQAAKAAPDIAKLGELSDALQKTDAYWSEQVAIQRDVAAAWIAHAKGRSADAVAMLRKAADREDATDKAAITPGPLKPARELLGEMLLEQKQAGAALVEFEAAMKKEPNRFRALYGGARAAQDAGDRAKAHTYFAKLVEVCRAADKAGRPELQEARKVARSGD
jgi:hypothetical protein